MRRNVKRPDSKQAREMTETATDVHKGIHGVMFRKEVGDVLIGLSVEQFRVFAIEVEIFLWAECVALEYVHRSLNEVFDKGLVRRDRAQY